MLLAEYITWKHAQNGCCTSEKWLRSTFVIRFFGGIFFLVHSAQEASGIDMNGNHLFSGTDNSMVGVWSLKTGNQVLDLLNSEACELYG